jgi:LPS export ABC transporter permease LptG/LPS export ABC transporter permease LptF
MLRILDRYLLREIIAPFLLALLLLTFALEIPPIIEQGERFFARGASWVVVSQVLLTLVPQALAITIPMAFLVGILIALGRLAGDREIVALEACGVSLLRLLRPLLLLGVLAAVVTTHVIIVAVPAANQAFREISFRLLMSAGSEIAPRVFFEEFPNRVIYVREVTPGVGWSDVMIADSSTPNDPRLYVAKRGRLLLDESKRRVEVVLEHGSTHSVRLQEPEQYEISQFEHTTLGVDPESVFPTEGPPKGDREMTIAELKARMAELQSQHIFPHNQIMEWQKKFSIPASCLAFMLVALGLGVSNRRDGRLASFVQGMGVVFVYWLMHSGAEALAKAQLLPGWFAWVAMWIPDMTVAVWGMFLLARKMRAPERPLQLALPLIRRRGDPQSAPAAAQPGSPSSSSSPARAADRVVVVIKVPNFSLPRLSILDWYILQQALRVSVLGVGGLLILFYIATFMDLADHLFKGRTTLVTILRYLWFATPQFAYYAVPLAVLIAALVTIGALTKNSELIVMKACGISLYRAAVPLLMLAVIGSFILLGLEERVLAYSNRRANAINDAIRGRLPATSSLNRRWIAANNGNIYQYFYFDANRNQLNGLSIYEFGDDKSTLRRRTYVAQATYKGDREAKGQVTWEGRQGWQREFTPRHFEAFETRPIEMEGPGYFGSERPDAERMSYSQLREHVAALQASGFNVTPYIVALHRKLAFPFVTLIMALIAVPFAVTTGKRGAMYGIGAGIVLAILYWTAISVFGAIGAGGLMAPALAAWAPNIIFGCAALYLILTVRT